MRFVNVLQLDGHPGRIGVPAHLHVTQDCRRERGYARMQWYQLLTTVVLEKMLTLVHAKLLHARVKLAGPHLQVKVYLTQNALYKVVTGLLLKTRLASHNCFTKNGKFR